MNPPRYRSDKPAIAQLVEHLTVECCSNQMVPGSIPGGRILGKQLHDGEGSFVRAVVKACADSSVQKHCASAILSFLGMSSGHVPR